MRGFEFSDATVIGNHIILVDNETRRIAGGVDGEDDSGEQALFHCDFEPHSGKIKLARAWPKSFVPAPQDYDDIEGLAVRKVEDDVVLYMVGSHSTNNDGELSLKRHVLIRLILQDQQDPEVKSGPHTYTDLMKGLVTLAKKEGWAVETLKKKGKEREVVQGINLEGAVVLPGTNDLLLGVRHPVPGQALVLRLHAVDDLFDNPPEEPVVSLYARLNLDGRGISSLHYDAATKLMLVAVTPLQDVARGDYSSLWLWDYNPPTGQARELLRFPDQKLEGVTVFQPKANGSRYLVLTFDEESENGEQFGKIAVLQLPELRK